MSKENNNLEDRVNQFNAFDLQGQPRTGQLVNDLWREVQKLQEEKQPAKTFQPVKPEEGSIKFHLANHPEETLKLEKGFFWYRGEKITDINETYERFSKWMTVAEDTKEPQDE